MNCKTKMALPVICTALFATAFILCGRGQSTAVDDSEPQINRTVVMSGVSDPWDLAFAPDGAMLFTEKCREVAHSGKWEDDLIMSEHHTTPDPLQPAASAVG